MVSSMVFNQSHASGGTLIIQGNIPAAEDFEEKLQNQKYNIMLERKIILVWLNMLFALLGNAQMGTEQQFKGLNKKREFRISVTGCNASECDLEIDLTGLVIYDFVCQGNSIVCNPSQMTRNDTAVFIDLRYKKSNVDSVGPKKVIIHNNERLVLRIEKEQGLRVKKGDVVYFLLLVNDETWYIKSRFYDRRFCKRKLPHAPGMIKLQPRCGEFATCANIN